MAASELAANLAALLGAEGVAHLDRRCAETVARAHRDGVSISSSLAQVLAFVEQIRAAAPAPTRPTLQVAPVVAAPALQVGEWVSTKTAAERLRLTPQAVRDAAQRGDLIAQRRGHGRGVLVISVESVERYAVRSRRSA